MLVIAWSGARDAYLLAGPPQSSDPIVADWQSRQPPYRRGISSIGTQTAQAGHSEVNKAWLLAVLSLTVFANISVILIIPPLLVEIATDLEISVAAAGQLATATFAGWAFTGVSGGPLSDSFGRRPVVLGGLAVLTVSILASAFAPNFEALIVLRVLTGLGGGIIPPTVVGAVADVISTARRAQALGILVATQGLASAISVPGVALLANLGDWRFAFMVAGLMLGAVLLANWVWLPRDGGERVRNWVFFSRYWSLVSLRFFRVAVVVNLTQRIAFWGTISFFAAYLIHTYELSLGFVALPLAIVAIGQMIGSYAAALVVNRRQRAALIAAATVSGGVCGLLFFTVEFGLWASVAVATVGTGLLSVSFPALVTASTEYSGQSKATGVGLMGFSNQVGGVLGAGVAGALLASMGYAGIGYLCLGVSIASALLTTLFGRQFGQNAGA